MRKTIFSMTQNGITLLFFVRNKEILSFEKSWPPGSTLTFENIHAPLLFHSFASLF
jgi:hypothetical protein